MLKNGHGEVHTRPSTRNGKQSSAMHAALPVQSMQTCSRRACSRSNVSGVSARNVPWISTWSGMTLLAPSPVLKRLTAQHTQRHARVHELHKY